MEEKMDGKGTFFRVIVISISDSLFLLLINRCWKHRCWIHQSSGYCVNVAVQFDINSVTFIHWKKKSSPLHSQFWSFVVIEIGKELQLAKPQMYLHERRLILFP